MESRCKNIHASPLRPLRLGEKKLAIVAFPSQSRREFSRKAAELLPLIIRENAERPSVLEEVHRDGPSLFLRYISSYSISPHILYLPIRYISTTSPHRPKVSLCSPLKAKGLSAVSSSDMYHLCGSINSAALREKSDNQGQHWVCVTLYHLKILASA